MDPNASATHNLLRDESSSIHPKLRGKRRTTEDSGGQASAVTPADCASSTSSLMTVQYASPLYQTQSASNIGQSLLVDHSSTSSAAPPPPPTAPSASAAALPSTIATPLSADRSSASATCMPIQANLNTSTNFKFETIHLMERLKERKLCLEINSNAESLSETGVNLSDWKATRILAMPPDITGYLPACIKDVHNNRDLIVQFDSGVEHVFEDVMAQTVAYPEIIADQAPSSDTINVSDVLCVKWCSEENIYRLAEVISKTSYPIKFQMRLCADSSQEVLWFPRANVRLLRPPWYDELPSLCGIHEQASSDHSNRDGSAAYSSNSSTTPPASSSAVQSFHIITQSPQLSSTPKHSSDVVDSDEEQSKDEQKTGKKRLSESKKTKRDNHGILGLSVKAMGILDGLRYSWTSWLGINVYLCVKHKNSMI
ncbi:hypothetical protein AB6A40_008433 [Gnathostoma spinigerum]|uniref:Protein capicua homolog-like domain-containing protein n=1 Tax=Gnathostoma spinigerum TaxID=75299 RepID=A0ABD6EWT4_9BILA